MINKILLKKVLQLFTKSPIQNRENSISVEQNPQLLLVEPPADSLEAEKQGSAGPRGQIEEVGSPP